jgi:hypothetical protein
VENKEGKSPSKRQNEKCIFASANPKRFPSTMTDGGCGNKIHWQFQPLAG